MIRQRSTTALVVTSWPSSDIKPLPVLPEADLVVAADGGLEVLRQADRRVHALVGDMDSIEAESLAWAQSSGAEIITHSTRKDFTDLELAIEHACSRAEAVHVIASVSGRLDHAIANLLILASPHWADTDVTATVDAAHIEVVRGSHSLHAEVGETVSLLAVGARCRVLQTCGLEYPLLDEWLEPASARGVSNVITDSPATINVVEGVLLAVIPVCT